MFCKNVVVNKARQALSEVNDDDVDIFSPFFLF
jgi:hypothetical protein